MVLAVPAPRLGAARRRRGAAERGRRTAHSGGVVGGGGVGAAGRHAAAAAVRGAGGQRRTVARQGDYAVNPQVGTAAATSSCCGCASAGSATTSPAARATTSCCPGRSHDLSTLFGVTTEPVDHHVQRWIDAMPQYGPGHGELVAELRAGLPPTLAVAGGLPRRHRRAGLCGSGHQGGGVAGHSRVAR